jgi:tRNA A37 N6-isopentenylltransferase MiaA
VDGATPVNIRAYRYPPTLKDEIERQVNTMLEQGLIQPSKSPFSSPVLLVHKKDGTWRFCVDYRYLNAMTMKLVYPIPVFEQLVDELGSASWTFTPDIIKSGYNWAKSIKQLSQPILGTLSSV